MVLDDITAYLASHGLGTVGQTIFKGLLPDQPDQVLSVLESPGAPMISGMGGQSNVSGIEQPRIQVTARAARGAYGVARALAHQVYDLLDDLGPVVLVSGSARYLHIEAVQPPFALSGNPEDQNERPRVVVNFHIMKERD